MMAILLRWSFCISVVTKGPRGFFFLFEVEVLLFIEWKMIQYSLEMRKFLKELMYILNNIRIT